MAVDVRIITADEAPAWVESMLLGFHRHLTEGEADVAISGLDLSRALGAFDDDRVVGTLRSWASELTLPGGALVPAAALTNVTVAATHRRQGLLTRMLTADLAASAERGEVAGILIAAEYPIYGRFGYGPATEHTTFTVDTKAAHFGERRPGSVHFADLAELRKVGPALYEQFRRQQPGSITRLERWWDRTCRIVTWPAEDPYKGYILVGRSAGGEPDGYVRYHIDSKWDGRRAASVLVVDELLGVTPEAYERLWRACCEVDWVVEVRAEDRSVEEAVSWVVADGSAVRQSDRADFLWLRPLDVPALLAARAYLVPGRVVVEVTDPLGYASCARTTEEPGLTLGVDVLGAISLGGASLRLLAEASRVAVHDTRALAVADTMFRAPITPWCNTWF
jgi:predicted acetyltransferase